MLGLFFFTLWMSGIDSAMGYCEGFIANIMDYDMSLVKAATAQKIKEAIAKAEKEAKENKTNVKIPIDDIKGYEKAGAEIRSLYWPRWRAAAVVCAGGAALCLLFTSNWGWILFDFVDHYISAYIIIVIGLCQCISVGWLFEWESTASRSAAHRASLRSLALIYWCPTVLTCIYANFGFTDIKWLGVIFMAVILVAATFKSF